MSEITLLEHLTSLGIDDHLVSALWLALDEVPLSEWTPEQIAAMERFSTLLQGMVPGLEPGR